LTRKARVRATVIPIRLGVLAKAVSSKSTELARIPLASKEIMLNNNGRDAKKVYRSKLSLALKRSA